MGERTRASIEFSLMMKEWNNKNLNKQKKSICKKLNLRCCDLWIQPFASNETLIFTILIRSSSTTKKTNHIAKMSGKVDANAIYIILCSWWKLCENEKQFYIQYFFSLSIISSPVFFCFALVILSKQIHKKIVQTNQSIKIKNDFAMK